MIPLFQRIRWWLQRGRREEELSEELAFHLEEETEKRRIDGLTESEARLAARRDLGNVTLVRENTRSLWSWVLIEQLAQDVRYGGRAMAKNRMFTALAAVSLALGIGANTAIYSFMDAILLRSLPVADPASLVVATWRSKPFGFSGGGDFVLHSIDGSTYDDRLGVSAAIFPFAAFERLQEVSAPVLSTLFAYHPAGSMNLLVKGQADLAAGEYVSGQFFRGLAIVPAAGRLIDAGDDRPEAPLVAVVSHAYSQRFGGPSEAAGQPILINNVAFTVVGVTPAGFFGIDPAAAPDVYLPLHAQLLFDEPAAPMRTDPNYYWLQMMGRLGPGVRREDAQALLAAAFEQWVIPTATERERANLPVLRLENGAGGLDSLRRQYAKPLYLLLAMVGLILAIACANIANLLLARAAARRREMAVRLSLGAGRGRIVRQLLTESVLLASIGGAIGIAVALIGVRVLTRLLSGGDGGVTIDAGLNWQVLALTTGLSLLCGVVFGLAPAFQATRPAVMPVLRDRSVTDPRSGLRERLTGFRIAHLLVVAQMAISLLLLVAAGLFVRTLTNLHSIPLGFNREGVLLFELNAAQAGHPEATVASFYAGLRQRFAELPGVREATLSHASLIRAGRGHPITIEGRRAEGTRILLTGPRFFATLQIPLLRGREIAESDRPGGPPAAVVSEQFARTNFGDTDPIGRHFEVGGSMRVDGVPLVVEIVGIAASAHYGGLKYKVPPVVYLSYAQVPAAQVQAMTFAVRAEGDPLRHVSGIREIVRSADARVPVTRVRTLAADIDQTINQEIVFARLCTAFATLALVIACVGLYASMAYGVARRTGEIGLRMALGAGRGAMVWMVLREVCVLSAAGLAIGVPVALVASRLVESFLFELKANDPLAIGAAAALLFTAAFAAGYGPARKASRVDPVVALRHD